MTTKDKENYKVFIPSAGLGTRLGNLSKNLNKALVSIDNRPVISHVIEKFPKSVEIVIALGHKGDLVRNYLEIAHQDRLLTFVEKKNCNVLLCFAPTIQWFWKKYQSQTLTGWGILK
mgnify:CR=1 FL=1